MALEDGLTFVALGIRNGNTRAALDLLEDLIRQIKDKGVTWKGDTHGTS
jgi:hypothetical protein